jgi:hypothetical protein
VGGTWQGIYRVRKILPEIRGARVWGAMHTDTMEEVSLRLVPSTPGNPRPEAWKKLETIMEPHLVRAQADYAVGAMRIEVEAVAPGKPLPAWRDRSEADVELIERVVRSVAAALSALHERGLVHLDVRPETIFVHEEHDALHFTLGGLDAVTSFDRSGPVPMNADPFYAPPEAAGLSEHAPGSGLCAWDWWSLGRVLQELILGQHVVNLRWQSAGSRMTPELATRAENLLKEIDPAGPRAGAVEAMPVFDKRITVLLRGLLTSVRDARWGGEQVARWLNRETVKESYHLLRNEPLFHWRDQACTVAAAAELLRGPEHWAEGIEHIWGRQPGTLARFIGDSPAHRPWQKRRQEVLGLAESAALKSLAAPAVREALAAVALMQIAGTDFRLRGHRIDAAGLAAVFGADGDDFDGVALLQALTAHSVLAQIEEADPEAARLLAGLVQIAAAAESIARRNGWLSTPDGADRTALVRGALQTMEALRESNQMLHTQFACSSDPAMEKIFQSNQPSHAERVVLAWAAASAPRFGFLTPAEWAARELGQMRARGLEFARTALWLRLGRALSTGPWIFARGPQLAAAWIVVAMVIMIVWPGPAGLTAAIGLAALATGIRLAGAAALRGTLRSWLPEGTSWKFNDGAAGCRAEAQRRGHGRTLTSLEQARDAINADIAKLPALRPPPEPVPSPPGFAGIRAAGLAGWLLAGGALVAAGWHAKTQPPSWSAFRYAWSPGGSDNSGAAIAADAQRPAGRTTSAVAISTGDSAGMTANEVRRAAPAAKESWPYRPSALAGVYRHPATVAADSGQLGLATALAKKIVSPYKRETIATLIILRVPTAEKCGVMIYDGRRQTFVDHRVYLLDSEPAQRAWIEVGGRRGVYLGE